MPNDNPVIKTYEVDADNACYAEMQKQMEAAATQGTTCLALPIPRDVPLTTEFNNKGVMQTPIINKRTDLEVRKIIGEINRGEKTTDAIIDRIPTILNNISTGTALAIIEKRHQEGKPSCQELNNALEDFFINHDSDNGKENYDLVISAIENPNVDVSFIGESRFHDGSRIDYNSSRPLNVHPGFFANEISHELTSLAYRKDTNSPDGRLLYDNVILITPTELSGLYGQSNEASVANILLQEGGAALSEELAGWQNPFDDKISLKPQKQRVNIRFTNYDKEFLPNNIKNTEQFSNAEAFKDFAKRNSNYAYSATKQGKDTIYTAEKYKETDSIHEEKEFSLKDKTIKSIDITYSPKDRKNNTIITFEIQDSNGNTFSKTFSGSEIRSIAIMGPEGNNIDIKYPSDYVYEHGKPEIHDQRKKSQQKVEVTSYIITESGKSHIHGAKVINPSSEKDLSSGHKNPEFDDIISKSGIKETIEQVGNIQPEQSSIDHNAANMKLHTTTSLEK